MALLPNYQIFMTPVLEGFSDKKEKKVKEVEIYVSQKMNLTQEQMDEIIPSGTQTVLRNRIAWAAFHLYKAGLLERVKRGHYKITSLGEKALSNKEEITNEYLMKYESFRKFRNSSSLEMPDKVEVRIIAPEEQDPQTKIFSALKEIDSKIQDDLLDQLKKVDPVYFERIVLDLMIAMGYGGSRYEAAEMTKKNHDGGIDGIINEDPLGLDKIYLQAKRYTDGKVNSKEMQYFVGALKNHQSNKGVFIATSEFDAKSREMAQKNNIILIDGKELTKLMLRYNVAVVTREKIEIKELDLSYFDED
jgi:restriction system protein